MSIKRLSTGSISSTTPKGSKVWDQETFPGTFESIASIIISSGSTSSFSFTNIPQNYKSLQIRWFGKEESNGSSNWYGLLGNFNSDTSANYSNHYMGTYAVVGGGAQTNFADNSTGLGYMNLSIISRGNGDNITFGSGIIDIIDYNSTTKFKTMRSLSGFIYNPTPNRLDVMSGCWRSTNPITSIDISLAGAGAVGSTFSLYGIRG